MKEKSYENTIGVYLDDIELACGGTLAKASIVATRRKNAINFFKPIVPSGRLYFRINETINIKIKSLKCHKSEYNKSRCGFRGYEIR